MIVDYYVLPSYFLCDRYSAIFERSSAISGISVNAGVGLDSKFFWIVFRAVSIFYAWGRESAGTVTHHGSAYSGRQWSGPTTSAIGRPVLAGPRPPVVYILVYAVNLLTFV